MNEVSSMAEKKHDKPGRPFGTFAYTSDELREEIDCYFDGQEAKEKPPTITGLSLALGVSPQTLCNYGTPGYTDDTNYLDTITRARLRCLAYDEERSDTKEGVMGAKYRLNNNSERMGGLRYADRQEVDMSIAPISFSDDVGI